MAQGLQPLADSSFVVVAGRYDLGSSRLYVAHLRVPGLPRVVDSHYVPAAAPLATQTGRPGGPGLELYPNPTRETVAVRSPGTATAPGDELVFQDVLGRLVWRAPVRADGAQGLVSVRALPAGRYRVTLWRNGVALAARALVVAR